MVAHDHAEAADQAFVHPARDAGDDRILSETDPRRQRGEGPRLQRQATLQRTDQLAFERRQLAAAVRVAERDRLAGARARVRAPPRPARLEVEAEVDVELFFERQHDDRAAGVALDAGDHLVELRARGRGDHEPQVVAMLALVVVVDRGFARDARGDLLQALGRRGQRGQRARAQAARGEHRAHPAHQALRGQVAVGRDHIVLGGAHRLRDAREGPRLEREVALPLVEQAEAGGVERLGQDGLARHQKPVRAARVVKKMPLGLAESKPPICCLLAVS